ncbi:MAG: glycosyltransferase family 1 protein, partial [Chloroflexota bacterium]
MHLAINAFFWNKINSGSGQYIRYLVQHINYLVSDLNVTLVLPRLENEPAPSGVPPSVKVKTVPLRPGNLGKVIFEQIDFPRACREVGADLAHVP